MRLLMLNTSIRGDSSIFNLKPIEYSQIRKDVAALLLPDENIIGAFKTIRDQVVFTGPPDCCHQRPGHRQEGILYLISLRQVPGISASKRPALLILTAKWRCYLQMVQCCALISRCRQTCMTSAVLHQPAYFKSGTRSRFFFLYFFLHFLQSFWRIHGGGDLVTHCLRTQEPRIISE